MSKKSKSEKRLTYDTSARIRAEATRDLALLQLEAAKAAPITTTPATSPAPPPVVSKREQLAALRPGSFERSVFAIQNYDAICAEADAARGVVGS